MTIKLAKVAGQATLYAIGADGEIAGEVNAQITWYPGREKWEDMLTRMLAEAEKRVANGADASGGDARA